MIKFILNIIKSKTAESSKRLLALLTFLLLVFVIIAYTTKDNAVQMATILTSFILALLAVATYEKIKTQEDDTK
jgi:hypothetical protein